MDERAPSPAAVAQLTVNDLAAASAELAVIRQPRRPDLSDPFFRAPDGGSLLIRIGRDDPPLPLAPLRRIEREESKLSLRFSLGAHSRPASSSAAQRSAAGRREVRRPAAPPIRALMAAHHRPRATRVRIPYAPPSPAWMLGTRMVACVIVPEMPSMHAACVHRCVHRVGRPEPADYVAGSGHLKVTTRRPFLKRLIPGESALAGAAGLFVRRTDGLRLRRTSLAKINREDRHRPNGEELRLPVLEGLFPEVGGPQI